MANAEDALKRGLRPVGYQETKFDPISQQPYVESDSKLGRMAQVLSRILTQQREQEKLRQERLTKQFDMYKTLRESGYDPKSAHEAVQKNQFPKDAGGLSIKEREGEAKRANLYAQSSRAQAQTKTEEAKTRKLEAETEQVKTGKETGVYIVESDGTLKKTGSVPSGSKVFKGQSPVRGELSNDELVRIINSDADKKIKKAATETIRKRLESVSSQGNSSASGPSKIKVRRIKDGATGTIDKSDFNPDIYERI